jgi:four helix bundle protein
VRGNGDGATQEGAGIESVQDFRNIEAWRLSRELVVDIYAATRRFPADERFGLTSQLRRSTMSIGANIAEAMGRATKKDAARVLQTSVSEGNETLSHLLMAFDLGYLTQGEFDSLAAQLETVRCKTLNLLLRFRRRRKKRGVRRA